MNAFKQDLEHVEAALSEVFQGENTVLNQAALALLDAGGKRIRPALVLLSGQFGAYPLESLTRLAVALELIHMATLVHDDVIDDAPLRRGQPTVKSVYDNRIAMYTGDYLMACALEQLTTLTDPRIHRMMSRTLVEMCHGEIAQIDAQFKVDQQQRHYLRRIRRKTAYLLATSCQLGALVGGLSEREANQLARYGHCIGMSYQMIDDVLDLTATEEQLGKPVGQDLWQGHLTLPILYGMDDHFFKARLTEVLKNKEAITVSQRDELLYLLQQTQAIEKTYHLSELYLTKAQSALKAFPDQKAKAFLEAIAREIGERRL